MRNDDYDRGRSSVSTSTSRELPFGRAGCSGGGHAKFALGLQELLYGAKFCATPTPGSTLLGVGVADERGGINPVMGGGLQISGEGRSVYNFYWVLPPLTLPCDQGRHVLLLRDGDSWGRSAKGHLSRGPPQHCRQVQATVPVTCFSIKALAAAWVTRSSVRELVHPSEF